jgi:hypothetical protein
MSSERCLVSQGEGLTLPLTFDSFEININNTV